MAPADLGVDASLASDFVRAVNWAMWLAERITAAKGFHDDPPSDAECCALVHSEVSEILEYVRHPVAGVADDKIPAFLGVEAEGADVIIRLFSWYRRRGWRLPEAVVAKMRYNAGREHRHGGKRL